MINKTNTKKTQKKMLKQKKLFEYLYHKIHTNFIIVTIYLGVVIGLYFNSIKKIICIFPYIIPIFALAEPNLLLLPVVNSTSEPELLSSTFLMSGDEGFSESPVPEGSITEQPTGSGGDPVSSREAEGSESSANSNSAPSNVVTGSNSEGGTNSNSGTDPEDVHSTLRRPFDFRVSSRGRGNNSTLSVEREAAQALDSLRSANGGRRNTSICYVDIRLQKPKHPKQ